MKKKEKKITAQEKNVFVMGDGYWNKHIVVERTKMSLHSMEDSEA